MVGPSIRDPRLITAAVVALVLGATAGFALEDDRAQGLTTAHDLDQAPCDLPALDGQRLETNVRDTGVRRDHDAWQRTVTVSRPGVSLDAGRLGVCTVVGDIDIVAGDTETVELIFHVRATGSQARQAVETQELAWDLREDDGALDLVAFQVADQRGQGDRQASVDIELQLPETGPYELQARAHVGAIDLEVPALGETHLATSTGDIDAVIDHLDGELSTTASVGDVDLEIQALSSTELDLQTGTGDIDLHLPSDPATGYDVTGRAGVGDVDISIGPTETHDRHEPEHGPGEREHARSAGFDDKGIKVTIAAEAGVGDVDVLAGR